MTDDSWKEETKNIEQIEVQVHFVTASEFYYGDDKNILEWKNYSTALYVPFNDKNKMVTAADIRSNLNELIKYYEDVLRLGKLHAKEIAGSYFWIRPVILNAETNETLISFPWYDTLHDIRYLFSELTQNQQGVIFEDCEQGWEVTFERVTDAIYAQQFNFETGEICCQINFDRHFLSDNLPSLLSEVEEIVRKLTEHFGFNYWSPPKSRFGPG